MKHVTHQDTYLAHHGIKGQKWGIRRFQNEDGTLKNAKRRNKPESKTWKSKDAANLSDEEMKRRLKRLRDERDYRNLTESRKKKAAKWIARTATAILVTTAITAVSNKMQNDVYANALNKRWPPPARNQR